jgi:hypothetical protein
MKCRASEKDEEGKGNGSARNAADVDVAWSGIDHRPYRMQVCYRVAPTPTASPRVVRLDHEPSGERGEFGWSVDLKMSNNRSDLGVILGDVPYDSTLTLYDMGVTVTERSANWQNDAERRASNIENGLGFFGAVTRSSGIVLLSSATARLYNYRLVSDGAYPSCAEQRTQSGS